MGTKLTHPLWTHLPAIAELALVIAYIAAAGPLPAQAPVHFDRLSGAIRYGSPWLTLGLTIGLSVLYILLSALLDELWARQERAKTFNWLSLLDEVVVASVVGPCLGYLAFLGSGAGWFAFPWGQTLLLAGVSAGLAVLLEGMRPFHPHRGGAIPEETGALESALAARLKDRAPFVYWEHQNPLYVTLLTTLLPLAMLVAAVFSWFSEAWVSLVLILLGVLFVIPYGGQRTLVTRQDITVRFGIVGLRVLRLKTAEVARAELHEFAPLKDFGGYGIRFNRETKAYFLRGTRGVKLTMTGGKKYLIGSDHPERLLAVAQSVVGVNR